MKNVTLYAPDISCEHCIMAIKRAVTALPGVASVEGDPRTKRVTISYDEGKVDLEAIKAAMAEEGYPVASVEAVMP
jgi:copper chaperone